MLSFWTQPGPLQINQMVDVVAAVYYSKGEPKKSVVNVSLQKFWSYRNLPNLLKDCEYSYNRVVMSKQTLIMNINASQSQYLAYCVSTANESPPVLNIWLIFNLLVLGVL